MNLTVLQQKTSDHILNVFKTAKNNAKPHKRYLLADEVGLGKTVIAADVICKLAEENEDRGKPFIVYYMCGNERVTAQNKRKLIENCNGAETRDDRLSMQWKNIDDYTKDSKNGINNIWIIPLTPATTFTNKNSNTNDKEFKNQKEYIKKYYPGHVSNDHVARYLELNSAMYSDNSDPEEITFLGMRKKIVHDMFLYHMTPDMIILDEFQNYSKLLEGGNELFNECLNCSKYVLLLSATPYEMGIKEVREMNQNPFEDCTGLQKTSDNDYDNGEETEELEFKSSDDSSPNDSFRKLVKFIANDTTLSDEQMERCIKDDEYLFMNIFCRSERAMFYKNMSKNDEVEELYCTVEDGANHIKYMNLLYNAYSCSNTVWPFENVNFNRFLALSKESPDFVKFCTRYAGIKAGKSDKDFVCEHMGHNLFDDGRSVQGHASLSMLKRMTLHENIAYMLWIPPTIFNIDECYKNEKNPFWKNRDYSKTLVFGNYRLSAASIAYYLSKEIKDIQSELTAVPIPKDFELDDSRWLPDCLKIPSDNEVYNKLIDTLRLMVKEYLLMHLNVICAATNIDPESDEAIRTAINIYCEMGDLKSVLDEYLCILGIRLPDKADKKSIQKYKNLNAEFQNMKSYYCGIGDQKTQSKPTKILYFGFDKAGYSQKNDEDWAQQFEFSCGFAERFTDDNTDQGAHRKSHQKNLQAVFNSPFYPFVMATTSVAQEGLDFHNYCHKIVHWSIPKTPIAFEQREGRIDRYMSHLVRKRLVKKYQNSENWGALLESAENNKSNDKPLFPYWYVEKDEEAGDLWPNFIRGICMLPLSKEYEYYQKLKVALQKYNYYLGPNYQIDASTSNNFCPLKRENSTRGDSL